jgi:hypothetical protein
MSLSKSKARCPKCRSRTLDIIEIVECTQIWEQSDGYVDLDEGYKGEIGTISVYGRCHNCDHKWRFKCLQITDLVTDD